MSLLLGIAQLLLAVAFGMAGSMKTFTPIEALAQQMPWVARMPELIRFIGISELAGAAGMILPALTRIKPSLTPLAAWGFVVIMILATIFHAARGEWSAVPATIVLGLLAAFVGWGRTRKAPIAPR